MEQRYYILRVIAWILKGFAVLTFAGTLFASCAVLQIPSVVMNFDLGGMSGAIGYNSIGQAITTFLGGLLAALFLWGYAELIGLFIDVEENTRETAINSRREKVEQPRRRNLWEEP